jgi:hypothetical protein
MLERYLQKLSNFKEVSEVSPKIYITKKKKKKKKNPFLNPYFF